MKFPVPALVLLAFASPLIAQEPEVTLRFLSFPKNASPQPVELLLGEGETMEVKIPTNALSQPYKVKRLSAWAVGKMEPAGEADKPPSFTSYGSAPSLASPDQLILLIRNGKENSDGMRVIPMDNNTRSFGGGQFFFMNASKVDIAGDLGGTKFALKPGQRTIIAPKETKKRESTGANQFFTEFFFRKEEEARPFFSSTWPANDKARSMVFFYHDPHNERLRMHTIRDYIP
ncbi:hypothetical protein HZ994_06940 [Akkermansiaceae bacterium]|nr:hypothetical protein HZ994_06940 [Akkermansiaceae bacterium]